MIITLILTISAITIIALVIANLASRSSKTPVHYTEGMTEQDWDDLLGRPEDVVTDEDVYEIDPRIIIDKS